MGSNDCIFCRIPSDDVVIEENGFKGVRCSECGLIYISPRPSREQVVDLYGHDDACISAASHIGRELSKRLYARHQLRILKRYCGSGRLLEIGSGAGHFLDEARRRGFDPFGLELNPTQVEYIRSRFDIPCESIPLSEGAYSGEKFDVIFHSDVISHFSDPVAEFETMRDHLEPGGIMMFETGNLAEVSAGRLREVPRFQYPDHLYFFTGQNLRRLLAMTGFELLAVKRYSISLQLALIRLVARLRRRPRSAPKDAGPGEARSESRQPRRANLPRSLWQWTNYFARYRLGAVLPKKNRLQTMILVARERMQDHQ